MFEFSFCDHNATMQSLPMFIALLLLVFLEKSAAEEAFNVTKAEASDDTLQKVRKDFKKKFIENSLRTTSKHGEPQVSTIITSSKTVDENGVIMVTEKEVRVFFEEEEYESFQSENTNVGSGGKITRKFTNSSIGGIRGIETEISNSSQAKGQECKCFCPKLDTKLLCEKVANKTSGNNDGKVKQLKFFKTVPEAFHNDSSHSQTEKTNRSGINARNEFNSTTKSESRNTIQESTKNEQFSTNQRSIDDLADSCAEIMHSNIHAKDGVYEVYILGQGRTEVYCRRDQTRSGCAWTLFMRRQKISDLFDKSWQEYQTGFGDVKGSFFLGLENIHALTSDVDQELGIFTNFQTNHVEAEKYAFFRVGDESTDYIVEALGKFSQKSAIQRLLPNSKFSTKDKDNGAGYDRCAKIFDMGWWYSQNCKAAAKLSGVHAYLNAPVIMGLRPAECRL